MVKINLGDLFHPYLSGHNFLSVLRKQKSGRVGLQPPSPGGGGGVKLFSLFAMGGKSAFAQ